MSGNPWIWVGIWSFVVLFAGVRAYFLARHKKWLMVVPFCFIVLVGLWELFLAARIVMGRG